MLAIIKRIARRLFGWPPGDDSSPDPFTTMRVPKGHRPGGRKNAVALEEPPEGVVVEAVGKLFRDRRS